MKRTHDISSGRLDAAQIEQNFCGLHPPLSVLQAQAESARCYFCHDAPCIEACPTAINIPGFIRKISTGNIKGAAVDILQQNIMGATCAVACPVEELCEEACVRNTGETKPVIIGQLQRYATDDLLARDIQPFQRAADSGRRVAVVGAGPAGLACAHRLSLYGHRVDVFEARPKPGGLNEYGLADYKMHGQRAAREADFILALGGIEMHYQQALGRELTLQTLRKDYDAVFLGLGHNAVNRLNIPGEDQAGVHNAVDFIIRIRQEEKTALPVGRRVVVIGGGNTAIDIAVQMKKLGAEEVTLVYRRGEAQMGATDYEQQVAQTNGVLIRCWAQPVTIEGDDDGVKAIRFERTALDQSGRLNGTGEHFDMAADVVFKAIGQYFDPSLFDDDPGAAGLTMAGARIAVNKQGETSLAGLYAGGDCVAGEDLTVVAVAQGRDAAEAIHARFSAAITNPSQQMATEENNHG